MKKTLLFLISVIALWSSYLPVAASNDKEVNVLLSQDSEPEYIDKDPIRNRLPARPIVCTISRTDGITINGAAMDIILYEIWDADGDICLGSYFSESDFIDSLFSLEGEFLIRFVTVNMSLTGNLHL